ncbi:hypothetical protein DFJ73DRAFT_863547 [Zopfochytrium polystomum]|nr:hypothetical protein DFJ73DRAFT_863547 [Zopfochytrium polystomum]
MIVDYTDAVKIATGVRNRELCAFPVIELGYLAVVNEILLKPNWWEKLANPDIVAAWKADFLAKPPTEVESKTEENEEDGDGGKGKGADLEEGGEGTTEDESDDDKGENDQEDEDGDNDDDGDGADADDDDDDDDSDDDSDGDDDHGYRSVSGIDLATRAGADPEALWQLILDELGHIARNLLLKLPRDPDEPPAIATPVTAHGVHVADNLLPSSLLARLKSLAAPLEQECLSRGDCWHPNSDDMVLDLVHPSPYALVSGKTKASAVPNALFGDELVEIKAKEKTRSWRHEPDVSTRFQWLPSEVDVDQNGKVVIRSYINNLNPTQHSQLYSVLAACFQKMLPLFERAYGSLDTEPFHRITTATGEFMPVYSQYEWMEMEYRKVHNLAPDVDVESRDDFDAFADERWGNSEVFSGRPLKKALSLFEFKRSEAPVLRCVRKDGVKTLFEFEPGQVGPVVQGSKETDNSKGTEERTKDELARGAHCETATVSKSLKEKRLQVIFKISNILLTPEKPRYNGGHWHIEGMEHEAIMATGIIYYDMENITESRLTFRNLFEHESWSYEQSDFDHLEEIFGVPNEELNVQVPGTTTARAGRCVVFPNNYHHRVEPFELEDKTRPGFRKMMACFLIHPDAKIPSTSTVPMQQREWARDTFNRVIPDTVMPAVVKHLVLSVVNPGISRTEALELAKELGEERRVTTEKGFASMYGISLCEH